MNTVVIHNRQITPESLAYCLSYKKYVWQMNKMIRENHLNLNPTFILERTP